MDDGKKMFDDLRSIEDTATKDVENLPSVKSLRSVQTALSNLKDSAESNTKSSDITFATIFVSGLDGSVVREGEYARVNGSNPLLAAWGKKLEATLNGTSELGVDIKKEMFNQLRRRGLALSDQARAETELVKGRAAKYGANPENIGYVPYDISTPEFTTGTSNTFTHNGATYARQPDGSAIKVK